MDKDKKEEIEFFNKHAEEWDEFITDENIEVAKEVIKKYKIGRNNSVLDVGAGTGILYSLLKNENLSGYLGIDISPKMIEVFKEKHPDAEIRRIDFETNVELDKRFDFVIIYDTIPHLDKIDMVFKNARKHLKVGGQFLIIHSKTRKELKEHHDEISHNQEDPIPTDEVLKLMSWTYNFEDTKIKDEDYFLYSGKKKR
ncbi:MAG TPA: class I SAM-dependent methyltransferase [Halanaerobiales bacterium]|nr:class I SAM-dependent methyltransferase [Halanaerobiales bacterium]